MVPAPPPAASPRRSKRYSRAFSIACGIGVLCALYLKFGCPVRALTGVACPGCGMTRALGELLRLNFSAAVQYHPLVVFLPLLAVWLLAGLLGHRFAPKLERALIFAVVALFLLVYALRFFCGDPVVKPDFFSSVLHKIISFWRAIT